MPCWFFAAERMAQIAEGRKRKRTEFFNGIKEVRDPAVCGAAKD
jgi:hypothetical protein